MAKFAIYYIPPAHHKLYQIGSQILGYDIRIGKHLPLVTPARQQLGAFDVAWVESAQKYGFHMTTAGTFEYDPTLLSMDSVIAACDIVFNCFNPANPMTLHQHPTEFIWQGGFTGLRYTANDAFQTLHTVLCAYLPQFGNNSRSLRRLTENSRAFGDAHHMAHRTQNFFTPYIFDDFMPHFTLLNPYTGDSPDTIRDNLLEIVADVEEITVESMCLVRLRDDSDRYEIVHEFRRSDYPKAF